MTSYCVGLIGRIGSGKSTAAEFFHAFGVPIISADLINRALIHPGGEAYETIKTHFGASILNADDTLNQDKLRLKMIQEPVTKTWLEALLHPFVRQKIKEKIKQLAIGHPYCIIEIPLVIEKKEYPYLNKILFIDCEPSLQLLRIMQRGGMTREEAKKLIALQAPSERYAKEADDVIKNQGTFSELKDQIKSKHTTYLQEASKRP